MYFTYQPVERYRAIMALFFFFFFFFFFLNRVISVISVILRENTPIIPDSTGEAFSKESEIMRMVCLNTTEISEIKRLKCDLQGPDILITKRKMNNVVVW